MNVHDLEEQMDHDIDRVLQGLSSPPTARMEQRVLAALAQRQEDSATPAVLHSSWLPTPRLLWPLGVIATLIVAAVTLFPRVHKAPAAVATGSSHSWTQPARTAPPAPTNTGQPTSESRLIRPVQASHHRPPALTSERAATPAVALDPATCHCDPVAIAEASAPSRPAPPLPLTREERHMLMLIRSGEPQELAVLDPNLRDLEFQRVRADFNRFFAPPRAEASTSTTSGNTSKQGNDQP